MRKWKFILAMLIVLALFSLVPANRAMACNGATICRGLDPTTAQGCTGNARSMKSGNGLTSQATQTASIPRVQYQKVHYHGVEAWLKDLQVNPSLLAADVCLVLPDTRDWTPTFTIGNGKTRQPVDGWEMIDWRNPATLQGKERCFRVTSENPDWGVAGTNQLVVESIAIAPNELITEQDCLAAREKLAATHSAIQFVCRPTGLTHSIEVTQKPEELPVEEAYKTVLEAFSEIITGPWIFSIAAPTD